MFRTISPNRFSIDELFPVYSIPPEAGGAGGSAASGTPGAGGQGGGGSAAGTGTGTGTGDATPFSLADDAVVTINGQTGKWGEIRDTHYMPRAAYDRGLQFLNTTAANLDQQQQALLNRITQAGQGRGANGQPITEVDPFADIEAMAIVDGKSLAGLARKMAKDGFGALGNSIAELAKKVTALEKSHGTVVQATNTQAHTQAEVQFDNWVTSSLTALSGVQGLPEGVKIDPQDPFMRELTRDLYSSHEADSWKSDKEFQTALGKRVSQAIAFVRGLDKAAVEAGNTRRRNFLNPRKGAVAPGQEKGYVHQNGADLAHMLFSGADAASQGRS